MPAEASSRVGHAGGWETGSHGKIELMAITPGVRCISSLALVPLLPYPCRGVTLHRLQPDLSRTFTASGLSVSPRRGPGRLITVALARFGHQPTFSSHAPSGWPGTSYSVVPGPCPSQQASVAGPTARVLCQQLPAPAAASGQILLAAPERTTRGRCGFLTPLGIGCLRRPPSAHREAASRWRRLLCPRATVAITVAGRAEPNRRPGLTGRAVTTESRRRRASVTQCWLEGDGAGPAAVSHTSSLYPIAGPVLAAHGSLVVPGRC